MIQVHFFCKFKCFNDLRIARGRLTSSKMATARNAHQSAFSSFFFLPLDFLVRLNLKMFRPPNFFFSNILADRVNGRVGTGPSLHSSDICSTVCNNTHSVGAPLSHWPAVFALPNCFYRTNWIELH